MCLANVLRLSFEAKKKLSKLISIVFRFPQLESHIREEMSVLGVSHLLTIDDPEVHSQAIEAAYYLSQIHYIGKLAFSNELVTNIL